MNIKRLNASIALIMFIRLVSPQISDAQGTPYLSHLGSSADFGLGVDSVNWEAASFETGTAADGYSLDSIQLRIESITGSPHGFDVSLFTNDGDMPGSSLELLSGSTPNAGGIYTFMSSGITLAPSTTYWVVATSPDTLESGNWVYWAIDPGSYTSSDGWNVNLPGIDYSQDGSHWENAYDNSPFTLAINASAVPEPETCSLAGLGLLAIFLKRKKFCHGRKEVINGSSITRMVQY